MRMRVFLATLAVYVTLCSASFADPSDGPPDSNPSFLFYVQAACGSVSPTNTIGMATCCSQAQISWRCAGGLGTVADACLTCASMAGGGSDNVTQIYNSCTSQVFFQYLLGNTCSSGS